MKIGGLRVFEYHRCAAGGDQHHEIAQQIVREHNAAIDRLRQSLAGKHRTNNPVSGGE